MGHFNNAEKRENNLEKKMFSPLHSL